MHVPQRLQFHCDATDIAMPAASNGKYVSQLRSARWPDLDHLRRSCCNANLNQSGANQPHIASPGSQPTAIWHGSVVCHSGPKQPDRAAATSGTTVPVQFCQAPCHNSSLSGNCPVPCQSPGRPGDCGFIGKLPAREAQRLRLVQEPRR